MMVTKEFTFDAAHRLVKGYQGKCAHLHGHTYKVEVCVESLELDFFGFVINFDEINDKMKGWTNRHLDHATLISDEDTKLHVFLEDNKQKEYVFEGNPTAECIAAVLFKQFQSLLPSSIPALTIRWVRVWETPTSSAVCNG